MKAQLAGLYLRLSREDDNREGISQSIRNQREFLLDYCGKNGITVAAVYADDGYTGTNFNRPDFLRLLDDIEEKKINLVLTKDLSRLGRDYILTGYYLERYFPEHGVRYIAVNDGIDTAFEREGNDMSPFRAVFNDMYAKDISKKVRAAFQVKSQTGKFIGTYPPFGYRKDPIDKNHLLIDGDRSACVRSIYELFLAGETVAGIAASLSGAGVPTPAQSRCADSDGQAAAGWNYAMVRRILTAPVYKGDLVSHRSQKVNYKVERVIRLPPEDWVVVEGTHEGIVTAAEFARVQKRLQIRSYAARRDLGVPKPLTGILFCGDCGAPMVLWSNGKERYFVCSAWKKAPKQRCCQAHTVSEAAVLEAIGGALERLTGERTLNRAVILKLLVRVEVALDQTLTLRLKFSQAG